jgi:hypothetical protein
MKFLLAMGLPVGASEHTKKKEKEKEQKREKAGKKRKGRKEKSLGIPNASCSADHETQHAP